MALYEKFWDCPACGTEGISALRKLKCPNCGHTKSPQDKEHRSNTEITDSDGIELARGGPHWTCSSCGSVNLNKYDPCVECGNPKEASDADNKVIELGSAPPPAYTPKDSTEQWYQPPEPPLPSYAYTSAKRDVLPYSSESRNWLENLPWLHILIGLGALLAILGLGYLFFHTTEVQAEVTGFSWSRNIIIECYETLHESGWSQPIGAYNVRTSQKVHHYDPIYEEKTEQIYHEKTCNRDLGNGAEEDYDCSYYSQETTKEKIGDEPVYATWYEYDIDKWTYERSVHAEGNDRYPSWPEYHLKMEGLTVIGAERVGSTPETYTVHFLSVGTEESKNYSYSTTLDQWLRYEPGVIYPLKINSVNMIMNDPLEENILE